MSDEPLKSAWQTEIRLITHIQTQYEGLERSFPVQEKECLLALQQINSGRWVSWSCAGKRKKETMCKNHSINYNESDLARICAYVLGMNEFDEEKFKTQVQEIVVHENGDLLFRLKDGSEKYWERML